MAKCGTYGCNIGNMSCNAHHVSDTEYYIANDTPQYIMKCEYISESQKYTCTYVLALLNTCIVHSKHMKLNMLGYGNCGVTRLMNAYIHIHCTCAGTLNVCFQAYQA